MGSKFQVTPIFAKMPQNFKAQLAGIASDSTIHKPPPDFVMLQNFKHQITCITI